MAIWMFGHPTIATPNLDRMARQGLKLHAVLCGRMRVHAKPRGLAHRRCPIRSGMCSDTRRVLFPDSTGGLQDDEITIAEALKTKKYATACIGKWHLGHLPRFLPARHGFDSYYGIPYSNDMKPAPLVRGGQVLEEPVDQATLTRSLHGRGAGVHSAAIARGRSSCISAQVSARAAVCLE